MWFKRKVKTNVSQSEEILKNSICRAKDFQHIADGNSVLGTPPSLVKSKIKFNGKNNILFCEEGVTLVNSTITFNGDNALVYLGKSNHKYFLSLTVYHNAVFHMGRNNYINGKMNVILSERKHLFIGNEGIFSFGIWMRNADPHLIYDSKSGNRLNATKSIYIGDHVWIGQSAFLLKGTQIDSGSIIGAMSVVSGKKIGHNSIWAGNPVKRIAEDIFWDDTCVHQWQAAATDKSQVYADFIEDNENKSSDDYIYQYTPAQVIAFEDMERQFDGENPLEKLAYLKTLAANSEKNRFVHAAE